MKRHAKYSRLFLSGRKLNRPSELGYGRTTIQKVDIGSTRRTGKDPVITNMTERLIVNYSNLEITQTNLIHEGSKSPETGDKYVFYV